MKKYLIVNSKTFFWLLVCLVISFIYGTIYVVSQHNLRMGANDPQIQLAQDYASALAQGRGFPSIADNKVNLEKSLSPFVIIFDPYGKVVYSSANLDSKTPVPPKGVFDYAKKNGEDRITWQPKEGIREAVVIRYFSDKQAGFVLVARSLKEIENRERNLLIQVAIGWFFTIIMACPLLFLLKNKKI